MQTLKLVIISLTLILSFHNQGFATDPSEDSPTKTLTFSKLPLEVQELIFLELDQKSFLRTFEVCKDWNVGKRTGLTLNISKKNLDQEGWQTIERLLERGCFSVLTLQECTMGLRMLALLSGSEFFVDFSPSTTSNKAIEEGKFPSITDPKLKFNIFPSVTALHLVDNDPQDNVLFVAFGQAIKNGKFSSLKILDWSSNHLKSYNDGLNDILNSKTASLLTDLNLKDNNFGDDTIIALAEAITEGKLPYLTRLNLKNNKFKESAFIHLACAIVDGKTPLLTVLKLAGNRLDFRGKGFQMIEEAINSGKLPYLKDYGNQLYPKCLDESLSFEGSPFPASGRLSDRLLGGNSVLITLPLPIRLHRGGVWSSAFAISNQTFPIE